MTDILIVDDELGIRNILSEILGEQGYRVATAANVAEAKKAVTGRHIPEHLRFLSLSCRGTVHSITPNVQ